MRRMEDRGGSADSELIVSSGTECTRMRENGKVADGGSGKRVGPSGCWVMRTVPAGHGYNKMRKMKK